ncbi:hypothetical protein DPEC_G00232540 [Dallia pectoralis]|uniref:Uncharacterized protein n=1 Tax=Dallia pectoralis TaxID=75939 RepID=A0ACC2FXQ4_DALPE|nr:hypothetical protein DPEC_G00232540 [Dallia pectoralis]
MPTTSPAPVLTGSASSSTSVGDKRRVHFSSPTLAALPPNNQLGTIVGGAVGGALFLLLLLVLGGVCCLRQRQTFRGDYYTKQYIGPSDMEKAPPQAHLHPPKPDNGVDKDREEWGDRERNHERDRERLQLRCTRAQTTVAMNTGTATPAPGRRTAPPDTAPRRARSATAPPICRMTATRAALRGTTCPIRTVR